MPLAPGKLLNLLGLTLTLKEAEIVRNLKRFNWVVGGKRVGKTITEAYIALPEVLLPDRRCWIVAPSYDLAHRIWDYLELWVVNCFPNLAINRAEMSITNRNLNSFIKLKTADNPVNLKGEPLTKLIVEEAGDIKDEIWESFLQPNVSQRFKTPWGWEYPMCCFFGNAEAKNWFYDGLRREDPEYFSFYLPTAVEDSDGNVIDSNNPDWITVDELRKIKARTPKRVWEKDYLARFPDDSGMVFTNLDRARVKEIQKYNPRNKHFIGWDPAKRTDFSVVTAVDAKTHEVIFHSRSQNLDYVSQKDRVKKTVLEHGGARVVLDSTGLGEPIFDMLVRDGVSVLDYSFTKKTKEDLINHLAVLIEHGNVKIPEQFRDIWDELEMFGTMVNGRLKYMAPPGKHDDCVMSLALACWEIEGKPKDAETIFFDDKKIERIRRRNIQFQYS